jgi:HEAT repeat protein
MEAMRSKRRVSGLIVIVVLAATVILSADGSAAGNIEELITDLKSKDRDVQMVAVEELSSINDGRVIETLLNLVFTRAEDWRVKIKALHVLGNVQDHSVSDKLVTILNNPFLNEDCPAIKWNTAFALGKRFNKGTRAVESLIEVLDHDDIFLREIAIQSLGKIGDKTAVPFLLPALYDRSFAIKRSAIQALGNIGDHQAVPILKRIAVTDKDISIHNEVMAALKKFVTD